MLWGRSYVLAHTARVHRSIQCKAIPQEHGDDCALMPEMTHPCEHHREARIIRSGDHFIVAD